MPHLLKPENILSASPTGYVFTFLRSIGTPSRLNLQAILHRRRRPLDPANLRKWQSLFLKAELAILENEKRIAKHRAEVTAARGVLKLHEHLLRKAEESLLFEVKALQSAALVLASEFHPKPVEVSDGRSFEVIADENKLELRGRKPWNKRKKK